MGFLRVVQRSWMNLGRNCNKCDDDDHDSRSNDRSSQLCDESLYNTLIDVLVVVDRSIAIQSAS